MEAVVEDDDVDEEEDEEEEEEAPVFGRFGARVRNLFMAVLVRARCAVSEGLALFESLEPTVKLIDFRLCSMRLSVKWVVHSVCTVWNFLWRRYSLRPR